MEFQSDLDGRTRLMLSIVEDMFVSDPELRLCEGLRLLRSIETACARAGADRLEVFMRYIRPQLHERLLQCFGITPDPFRRIN